MADKKEGVNPIYIVEEQNSKKFQVKKYIIVGMWLCYVSMNNKKWFLGLPNVKSIKLNGEEQSLI